MKNILKIWLTRRDYHYKLNSYYPQVLSKKSLTTEDIIDEMVKEGSVTDKKYGMEFLNRFNKKAAELLLTGNGVDTGLVKLSAETSGYIKNKHWNPKHNKIEINILHGKELLNAISDTTIEVVGMDEYLPSVIETAPDYTDDAIAIFSKSKIEIPPCGIAFRNRILNA